MPAYLRLLLSALIAFCFYGGWAFWATLRVVCICHTIIVYALSQHAVRQAI